MDALILVIQRFSATTNESTLFKSWIRTGYLEILVVRGVLDDRVVDLGLLAQLLQVLDR